MKNVNNLCKTWQTSCVDFLLSSSHEAHITIQCKVKKRISDKYLNYLSIFSHGEGMQVS